MMTVTVEDHGGTPDPGHRTQQDIEFWAALLNFQGKLPKFTSPNQDPLTQLAVEWRQHHAFTADLPYMQAWYKLASEHQPVLNFSVELVGHITPDAQAWLAQQTV